ncbi:MAG TPA: methyltransferase domain-containing protein [Candidatus Methylomirabilis sp.]|nr:methyltransferase domain-containing protein [Candidatus Methylomirabilis sp.]
MRTRSAAGVARSFHYGRIAGLYDTGFRLLGFKRGVEQFLGRVEWRLPARARVLDAGAGTGIIALWVLRRFPDAEVVAFDIDRQMLGVLRRTASRLGEPRRRLIVALGDLRTPDALTHLDDGRAVALAERSFDVVVVGAALEHVPLDAALDRLARLLRPGGLFLNVGIRPGPTATALASVYRFRQYTTDEVRRSLRRLGFTDVRVLRFSPSEFPANLTRVGVMGRKG